MSPTVWGQAPPTSNSKRVAYAVRITGKITLDGKLSEPEWQLEAAVKNFTQREPAEGQPATEWTEVRILYDNDNLYIGAYCHDREPDKAVINDIRRDFNSGEQDYFGIILDTFDDDRNGYYLLTTPVGGQRDLQFFDEGRQSNISWDGVWHATTHRHEEGYTAEVAIPFKTLRFPRKSAQVWGAQFFRRIRRHNEGTYWAPIPRRYTVNRAVGYAGELRGIENVEPGRNFSIKPYALAGISRIASRGKDTEEDLDAGFDIKYGVGSNMVLDLTVNTDFSHVESDTQVVNLTRFQTFFPEKREFFLENAGTFQFGSPARNELLLFHSRRIGLVGGDPIPILGGVRLTGRAGRNTVGLMNIQTRSEGSVAATNFTATRLRTDFLSSSNIGAMFVNRQSGQERDYNRAFGIDTNLLFFQTDLRFSGFLAKTITPGRGGNDWAGKVEGEYSSNLVRFSSSYLGIQRNVNPEVGFVRRAGRRIVRNEFAVIPRFDPATPAGRYIRDVTASLTSEYTMLSGGSTETKQMFPRMQVEFQDGSFFTTQYTKNFERLTRPFSIFTGITLPRGDYRFNEFQISYASDKSKAFWGSVQMQKGDFYNGDKTTWTFGAGFRPNYHIAAALDYERNDVELLQGAFKTDLVGVRFDYAFNPRLYFNSFVQYNTETHEVASNIRLRFIHHPLSEFFIVYNESRNTELDGRNDRSLTVKYTHLLSF
ncbi:MAG: carbohydrate binding family 9 domain-containing protein [Acidobacteria bacterium]|nr:carbohydrate binding family 9 domain-containing protein [Acidobacteriota bacterium]